MSSPTDEDLERLRSEHGLDLTNVYTREDLEEALRNTTSKSGSKFNSAKQSELKQQLVDESNKWFELPTTQGIINENIATREEELEAEEQQRVIAEQQQEQQAELRETSQDVRSSISELRSASTVDEINDAIANSPSTTSVRKVDRDLASQLSEAIADAAERAFDLRQQE